MDLKTALESIHRNNIKYVRFEQTDLYGVARSKTIPANHFKEKATKGLNFYLGVLAYDPRGGFVQGSRYTDAMGHCDSVCFPDYNTFQVLPWSKNTARILIEPTLKGKSVEAHSRVVARKQLERLAEMGYSLLSAHEYEFSLVNKESKKPLDDSVNIWSTVRFAEHEDILYTFTDGLKSAGIDVECAQTEYGPGQIEITYKPAFGIKAADNALTYRTGIKEMAIKNGYMASFMTKPFPTKNGNSCHFCHSLWDVSGTLPKLYDASSQTNLTPIGEHWVAGLLAHLPAITLLCAPTVNCLKRFVPNAFAPSKVSWGIDNRLCAIRVKINEGHGTYVENRLGASGCNPYILLAATVAAGIDGIARKLPLPPATKAPSASGDETAEPAQEGSEAQVPHTMKDAIQALQADEVITAALGEEFIECFLTAKQHELDIEKKGEDDWENNLFFEYM